MCSTRVVTWCCTPGGRTAGVVGVALPGLRYKAYLLALHHNGDVQSALVAEFLKALRTVDLDQPGLINALLSTAFSKAPRPHPRTPASGRHRRAGRGAQLPALCG